MSFNLFSQPESGINALRNGKLDRKRQRDLQAQKMRESKRLKQLAVDQPDSTVTQKNGNFSVYINEASKASDDEKENEYKPELPPPTPTSEVEDEEVEDEEIKVGNDENCNSRPKTKRRRKNKMNRMKKKARRH